MPLFWRPISQIVQNRQIQGRNKNAQTNPQQQAIMKRPDSRPVLAAASCPTLVLVGNQDILTPRGDSEEIADRMPNAELVVISGAAHGFMVEHASTFNRVLMEFLGRVTKADQAALAATEAKAS